MAAEIPKSIRASLYIDGSPAETSLKNLTQVTNKLRRELDLLPVGTEEFNKKLKELQQHQATLNNIRAEVNNVSSSFQDLTQEISKFGSLALSYLGFSFITEKFQGIITGNAKLSDSLADVRRTTGLTEQAVRSLYSELGKIDTRTSKDDLLKIAQIGGQFNVPTEQLKGFVEQIDKVSVVLGTEFKGGAESITNELSLLRNVFTDIKTDRIDDDLGYIANAMIVLAQAGAASAPVITEISKRLSPLISTAKLTSGAILGISARLEELGVAPEAAASSVLRLFDKMISNAQEFSKVAGMSGDAFTKLLEKDSFSAFTKVLEGFKKGGDNVEVLNRTVEDLEVSGVGAKGVLTKLSDNVGELTQRVKAGSEALTNQDAITEQYQVSNNNLAADIEKLGKKFSNLSASTTLIDLFQSLIIFASKSIDVITGNARAIGLFAKVMIVGAVAWGTYRAATALATAENYAFITSLITAEKLEQLEIITTTALSAAKALLTGNIRKAKAEWALLNVVMEANPWALAIAGIAALVTALSLYTSKLTFAAKVQQELNSVQAEADRSVSEQTNRVKTLTSVINSEVASKKQRLAAVNQLRDIMPDYLKGYTDEQLLAGKTVTAVNEYIATLEKKAKAEAGIKKLTELDERKTEINEKIKGGLSGASFLDLTKAGANATGGKKMSQAYKEDLEKQLKEIEDLQAEVRKNVTADVIASVTDKGAASDPGYVPGKTLDSLKKKLEGLKKAREYAAIGSKDFIKLTADIAKAEAEISLADGKADKAKAKKAESEAEKAKKQALKDFEALDQKYRSLNLQRLDDQMSANEKEVAQEEHKYDALIRAEKDFLKQKGATPAQKTATQSKINDLQTDKDKAVTDLRLRQETEMLQSIAELRKRMADVHESELVKEQDQINRFYDAEEKKNAGNQKVLGELKIAREIDLNSAELREKERLEKEKLEIESKYATLSGNKKEDKLATINKKYDDELIALKFKFSRELQATQAFQDAKDAIEKNRAAEIKKTKLEDLKAERNFEIQAAQDAANATFSLISSNSKAKLEAKLSTLESERQGELSAKNLTEKQKEAINAKYDEKVKEEKLKGWKADQAAAVAQALVNGALAVTKVLAQTGVLAPFAIPAIVAGTAAQVAVIVGTPPPKFANGGYSDEDPAGYVGQSTLFSNSASGRPFEAGEKGKEWIAPNWMVSSPRFANIIGMLEVARKEKRAFAQGGFTGTAPAPAPGGAALSFDRLEDMMLTLIELQKQSLARPVNFIQSEYEDFLGNMNRVKISQMGTG